MNNRPSLPGGHRVPDDAFTPDRATVQRWLDAYVADNQENARGIRCLAVAVGDEKPPLNAISCSVPVVRLDSSRERDIVDKLMRARQLVDRLRT